MIVNDGQGNLKCLSLHIILHIATGPRSAYNSALSLILFGYYKQDCSAMHHFEPLHAANLMHIALLLHLTKCFRATAGALVSQVKPAVRRARATASARALDRATLLLAVARKHLVR